MEQPLLFYSTGSLLLLHFWPGPLSLPGLPRARRMGTYLFKTSRIPWKEKKMKHVSMCCSREGADGR